MDIYLHNTLTGKKEKFEPITAGHVSMYNCGPTVYNYAHIGNLRSYVFADVLRRMFEYNEYEVKQVINITDIGHLSSDNDDGEDKMTKALKREGKPLTLEAMREVANFYFEKFKEDLTALSVEMPEKFPFASDHIQEDIDLVSTLTEKGFTYTTSDGIYFDVSKFPEYGKLGNIKIDEGESRIGLNPEKKSSRDFAVWKFNTELGYDAPFGKGFPGWHIECSAMSKKYLGQPFDVHTGGIDHISIHHNNEIAQSEAAYDVPLANMWMHNEHLNLNGEKMAKSGEGFVTLQTLIDRNIDPLAYRYLLLSARYSSPLQFSWEALEGAEVAWKRLRVFVNKEEGKLAINNIEVGMGRNPEEYIKKYKNEFISYINDDLDTPKALAFIYKIINDFSLNEVEKKSLIIDFDRVLGLDLDAPREIVEIPDEVQQLITLRDAARAEKDFAKSDELRAQIEALGFEVMDTAEGTKVKPR